MSRVRLGRVAGVYGVQGWLRIASDTRPEANIFRYQQWWLGDDGSGFASGAVAHKVHANGLIAQLRNRSGEPIADRDEAQRLVGKTISVERSSLPRLPEGEYYWIDLMGAEVVNLEGASLGTVVKMTSNGAQDVLVIADGDAERLIPFVHGAIVQRVDMEARRIVCDWQLDW